MKTNKEQELKNEDYLIPITQKDVINSKWVQEIKDKVITPCGDSIGCSLTGMWDLCGNINSFVKEKVQEAKQDEIEFLERLKSQDIFNRRELIIKRLKELKK